MHRQMITAFPTINTTVGSFRYLTPLQKICLCNTFMQGYTVIVTLCVLIQCPPFGNFNHSFTIQQKMHVKRSLQVCKNVYLKFF